MTATTIIIGRGVALTVIVALLTLATDNLGFRSPLNALWMLGVPLAVVWPLGSGFTALARLTVALGLSLLTMIVTAALFNLGP